MLFYIFHYPQRKRPTGITSDHLIKFKWLILSFILSFKLNSGTECFFIPVNIFQIHVHRYLHVRVSYKDICKRILFSAVFLLEGSMELAGLHCHCHGVSNDVSGAFHSRLHAESEDLACNVKVFSGHPRTPA